MTRRLIVLSTLVGCATSAPESEVEPPSSTASEGEEAGALDPATKAQLLEAHNVARARVGASTLTWSDEVAATAQGWAEELAAGGCNLQHNPATSYGENLYWTTASQSGSEVTVAWTAESANYDAERHACARGKVCGHYTQVVWAATTTLGCGVAGCGSAQVWVCNYDPPGNFQGQRPF